MYIQTLSLRNDKYKIKTFDIYFMLLVILRNYKVGSYTFKNQIMKSNPSYSYVTNQFKHDEPFVFHYTKD